MARGRVAHLIEWKGWSAQQSGWELSPTEDEHYCCLPDELREARFAAGEWWWGHGREPAGWICRIEQNKLRNEQNKLSKSTGQ